MSQPPQPSLGAPLQRAAQPEKKRWQVVAAIIAAGVLLLGAEAFAILKPDRAACASAINSEVDRILASDVPVDDQPELKDDPAIKARVAWPCRFQSDAQIEAIGREVFAKRLPEFLIKGLGDAFSDPEDAVTSTPTPTAETTPTWTTTKGDWKVSLKTKSKKCFGYGFGCIVTVSPKISWEPVIYDGDIPEDVTIEITYKIKGDKDGTITDTTEVDDQGKYYASDEVLTTRSRSTKITAVVTKVEVTG